MSELSRVRKAQVAVLRADIVALQRRLRTAGLDDTLPSAAASPPPPGSAPLLTWRRALCVPVALPILVVALLAAAAAPHFHAPPGAAQAGALGILSHPDLPAANRLLELAFPVLFPLSGLGRCPLHPKDARADFTDAQACGLADVRRRIDRASALQYSPLLTQYEETVVTVPAGQSNSDDHAPVEVVLLRPKSVPKDQPLPLVLWMHGGGMVLGTHRDGYAGPLVDGLRARGVAVAWASVRYRLAPEHGWPQQPNDCFRALQHLLAGPGSSSGDGSSNNNSSSDGSDGSSSDGSSDEWRVGLDVTLGVHLAGVSAGGNLAVATALRALSAGLHVTSLFVDEPMLRLEDVPVATRDGGVDTEAAALLPGATGTTGSPSLMSPEALAVPSWSRNAFTRTAPVVWLDWCWRAYLRGHCAHGLGGGLGGNAAFPTAAPSSLSSASALPAARGLGASPHGACSADSVGGGMGSAAWQAALAGYHRHHRGNASVSASTSASAFASGTLLRAAVVVTARGCPMRDAGVALAGALRVAAAASHPDTVVTHVDARGSHALPFVVDPTAAAAALDAWRRAFEG